MKVRIGTHRAKSKPARLVGVSHHKLTDSVSLYGRTNDDDRGVAIELERHEALFLARAIVRAFASPELADALDAA